MDHSKIGRRVPKTAPARRHAAGMPLWEIIMFEIIGVLLVITVLTASACSAEGTVDSNRPATGCGSGSCGGAASEECATDADCEQPDRRCGSVVCVSGICERSIAVGPMASQIKGDCKQMECDADGHVITTEDASDVYNDGLQCTEDACVESGPVHTPREKGSACPESEGLCDGASLCVACVNDDVCAIPTVLCLQGRCSPAYCMDKGKDGSESDIDCGGQCIPCAPGRACKVGSDCTSGVCSASTCAPPTCTDGVQNGSETGIDCGTSSCGTCKDGQGCKLPEHCQSGVCWVGKCQEPTCFDGVRNGNEPGPDCGGPCEASCL